MFRLSIIIFILIVGLISTAVYASFQPGSIGELVRDVISATSEVFSPYRLLVAIASLLMIVSSVRHWKGYSNVGTLAIFSSLFAFAAAFAAGFTPASIFAVLAGLAALLTGDSESRKEHKFTAAWFFTFLIASVIIMVFT